MKLKLNKKCEKHFTKKKLTKLEVKCKTTGKLKMTKNVKL